jgi:hypothetical protein
MTELQPGMDGLGFLLNYASRSVVGQMRDKLRTVGLDHDMWTMMQGIRVAGEAGANPEKTAVTLRMPKGAMIDAAERLVRDGWAKPVSKRSAETRLVLTPKATKVMHALNSEARLLLGHATNGFTQAEIDELGGYLKRIIDNMA